jgi:2'-5' RNA ligase
MLHEHGSTQINLPDDLAKLLHDLTATIEEEDLHGRGRDVGEPHITVRYGIKDFHSEPYQKLVKDFMPFYVRIGSITSFSPSEHSEGAAPLIFQVHSPQLMNLNKAIEDRVTCAPANFDYKPHITIAFVKPDKVDKYKMRKSQLEGKEWMVKSLWISSPNEKQREIT